MKKVFLIAFLFLLAINGIVAKTKWQLIDMPQSSKMIIGGESIHDFWVLDTLNSIVHYSESGIFTFPIKSIFNNLPLRDLRPILMADNKMFVLFIDKDWKTHIAEINNNKLITYPYIHDGPLYHINKLLGNYYASGDFGAIVMLDKLNCIKIQTPIKKSILSTYNFSKRKVFYNIHNGGIWSWNGSGFYFYPKTDSIFRNIDVVFKSIGDTLYIKKSKHEIYKLIGKQFIQVDSNSASFQSLNYKDNNWAEIITNKQEIIKLPLIFEIVQLEYLNDGTILLLSKNNTIYKNQKVSHNFFMNYAATSGIEGSRISSQIKYKYKTDKSYYLTQLVACDIDNNAFEDILLFDQNSIPKSYMFVNNRESYFNNTSGISGISSLLENTKNNNIIDLNQDDSPEIICSDILKNEIRVYKKDKRIYLLNQILNLPEIYTTRFHPVCSFTDIDADGDLDLSVVLGYSKSGAGSVLFYKNNGFGYFSEVDTSLSQMLKGWNVQTIYGDYDNNGLNDIFVARNWGPNYIYFQKENHQWVKYRLLSSCSSLQQRKKRSLFIDFDNDGDLDLFSIGEDPSISFYINNGDGTFLEKSKSLPPSYDKKYKNIVDVSSADFDNNGFLDLLLISTKNNKWHNYILLNDSAKGFVDYSLVMGISNEAMNNAILADIDNDGDIDIYGTKDGYNSLWINNLDSNNYIDIKLKGDKSNRSALGAKIYLYSEGHLLDSNYLCAYRQLGTKLFGFNNQSQILCHFGVQGNKKYDIFIQFYAGGTKKIRSVNAGQTLIVHEIDFPYSLLYSFDNYLYQLFSDTYFLIYILVFLMGILTLWLSIKFGIKLFNWDVKLTSLIISLNLGLFILLLFSLSSFNSWLSFTIPLGIIVLGSIGPLGFFMWMQRFSDTKSEKENKYLLFQSLQNFSHGAWASSNLNSLQLLFENLNLEDLKDEHYKEVFQSRKETFLNLTLPIIDEISDLTEKTDATLELHPEVCKYTSRIKEILNKEFSEKSISNNNELTKSIIELRKILSNLKKIIFAEHACTPSIVYRNIEESIIKETTKHNIELKLSNLLNDKDIALIEAQVLADIIDNCVQNSIKSLNKLEKGIKNITIKLIKDDLRYYISITDNGIGIPEAEQNLIFENGFSTNSSSGFGLHISKEQISKYGGRIYLKSSIPMLKTQFIIELQKITNQ